MAVDKTKDVQVGGTLHSIATGNIIAHADEVMDEDYGKKQSVINQELSNRLTEELKGYLPLTGGTMNGGITFESEPDTNEYVDLGLPSGLLWAKYNIGANSEEESGLYFQWGDTQGYTAEQVGKGEGLKKFFWDDYKFSIDGSSSNFSKYNASDSKTVLDPEDDAAHVNMGGNWRMPTFDEYVELLLNTDIYLVPTDGEEIQGTVEEQGGSVEINWASQVKETFKGVKLYKKGDKQTYMFVPAAGSANEGSMRNVGKVGYLWSSSCDSSGKIPFQSARFFNFGKYNGSLSYVGRYAGYSVRGVCPKSDASESNTENIITVSGKTSTDLLNAAGGTTSVDTIRDGLATKDEVDDAIQNVKDTYLPLAGGTLTGDLVLNENLLVNKGLSVNDGGALFTAPVRVFSGNNSRLLVTGNTGGLGTPGVTLKGTGQIQVGYVDEESGNLSINKDGITIPNKTENDLLNAAGGTTVLKTIGGESLLGEGNIELATNSDIDALFETT